MTTFTLVHVAFSVIGLASGFVVMSGLLTARRLDGWTALFLASTVATSASGFGFPFDHLLPSHVVGIISLVVLAVAVAARYSFRLVRSWRLAYVVSVTVALYLNVFVGVVQAFQKVPALKTLAPTQSEAPFAATQLVVLAAFVTLGVLAAKRFRIEAPARQAHAAHV